VISWFGLGKPVPATVELAALKDASALAALHGRAFHRGWGEDEFRSLMGERNVLTHRLRRGSQVIGFAISRIAADEAELLSIAIADKARGGGLSRDLLNIHLGHLAGRGVRTVFLEVDENNVPARRLYARAGFSDVGRRERYYRSANGTDGNAVVMRRDLF
jgi:ribosomal-protein-alanine N-acetyltransferase